MPVERSFGFGRRDPDSAIFGNISGSGSWVLAQIYTAFRDPNRNCIILWQQSCVSGSILECTGKTCYVFARYAAAAHAG